MNFNFRVPPPNAINYSSVMNKPSNLIDLATLNLVEGDYLQYINGHLVSRSVEQVKSSLNLGELATLTNNSFNGNQVFNDGVLSMANFKDCSIKVHDLGLLFTTSTLTIDGTNGNIQRVSCMISGITITLNLLGWSPVLTMSQIEIQLMNFGLATLAFTQTIQWKKRDDTYTTSISTYLTDRGGEAVLKSSGLDTFLFWTIDSGSTIYGAMI